MNPEGNEKHVQEGTIQTITHKLTSESNIQPIQNVIQSNIHNVSTITPQTQFMGKPVLMDPSHKITIRKPFIPATVDSSKITATVLSSPKITSKCKKRFFHWIVELPDKSIRTDRTSGEIDSTVSDATGADTAANSDQHPHPDVPCSQRTSCGCEHFRTQICDGHPDQIQHQSFCPSSSILVMTFFNRRWR